VIVILVKVVLDDKCSTVDDSGPSSDSPGGCCPDTTHFAWCVCSGNTAVGSENICQASSWSNWYCRFTCIGCFPSLEDWVHASINTDKRS